MMTIWLKGRDLPINIANGVSWEVEDGVVNIFDMDDGEDERTHIGWFLESEVIGLSI